MQQQPPCSICKIQFSKYKCPKCNIHYCSLTCFKKHNQGQCSNVFQQEHLQDLMNSEKLSNTQKEQLKRQTLEMLQRVQDFDQTHDDDLQDAELQQVMAKLDLCNDEQEVEQVLQKLPEWMKQDFESSLKDGRMSTWLQTRGKNNEEEEDDDLGDYWWRMEGKIIWDVDANMLLVQDIKPLSQLSKAAPLETLRNDLLHFLYAYAYVQRLFMIQQVTSTTSNDYDGQAVVWRIITAFLFAKPPTSHMTASSALQTAIQSTKHHEVFQNWYYSIAIVDDVAHLCKSKAFVLRALMETSNILGKAKQLPIYLEKKIYFFRCYVNDHVDEPTLQALQAQAQQEFQQQVQQQQAK